MREVHGHKVYPANDKLKILALDDPGPGGANHCYEISGAEIEANPSYPGQPVDPNRVALVFQNGPIAEAGVNGVTPEALLVICADRLRSFQAGPYACRENALALTKIEEAMLWLQKRTLDRMARGVEGTHKV